MMLKLGPLVLRLLRARPLGAQTVRSRFLIPRNSLLHRCFGCLGIIGCLLLTSCSLPQVSAESRLFLDLSLSPLAEYRLGQPSIAETATRFSAVTYDRNRDRLYALAASSPSVYTLALDPPTLPTAAPITQPVEIEAVMPLVSDAVLAVPLVQGTGIALTPRSTLFMASTASETAPATAPRLSEFRLSSGRWLQDLPLPKQYGSLEDPTWGVQVQGGLKAMTTNPEGDRLFAATELPLRQDASHRYSRLLHYWISEPEPLLISEHLYPLENYSLEGDLLESSVEDGRVTGLADIVPLDSAGHFLSLENTYSPSKGHGAAIYQFVTGVATDTSLIRSLPENLGGIAPILKRPLLNLEGLQTPLPPLTGMVLGPYLSDGSRSVVLLSGDDLEKSGLEDHSPTQLLLLRLSKNGVKT